MRILFLASALPSPVSVSGFIVIYERIRHLVLRKHEVGLACFVPANTEFHEEPEIASMLFELETVPLPRRSAARIAFDPFASTVPAAFRTLSCKAMQMVAGEMVRRSSYDVVIAEFSQMGQYLHRNPYLPPVRRIISCHSCYTTSAKNQLKVQHGIFSKLATVLSLPALERYEFDMYRNADHVVVLTPEERQDLHHYDPSLRISISPYGVDTNHYKPNAAVRREQAIVFTGDYSHLANQDAVLWFVRSVWPALRTRYPDLRFYVVGRGPTRDLMDLARKDSRIVVTGEVEDLSDYLAKAAAFICPIRMGKGQRGKVLQAMAAGVPVVSTSLAAEGISAQSGHNILLADTPHTMSESICLLLDEAALSTAIAERGRQLATTKYSWPRCVDRLEEALHKVVR